MLPSAKDYKRIGEGDTGLNTGGMGAVSPPTFLTQDFFNKIEKVENVGFEDNRVAVYLTDGYGDFPKNSSLPTLWLVTHDGLGKESFPFGETIRISK